MTSDGRECAAKGDNTNPATVLGALATSRQLVSELPDGIT